MATKKKTEVEAVEEVKEVEAVEAEAPAEVVEEAPKKTTKKSSKKKAEPVEELVEEEKEAPAEEVKEAPAEVEAPKKVEKKAEPSEASYKVTSNTGLYTFKGPSFDNAKGKPLAKGSVITVTEVKGNWGKIGQDRWILIGANLEQI